MTTKKAYFIGIAGTTMANLAIAFKSMGWEVTGSDQKDVFPPISTFLEANNINYFKGYSEEHLSFVPDMVVVGRSALMIEQNNPEYLKAKKLGCKILSYPEVLSEYLVKKNSIVIAGTYGKSTTAVLISWILINAGFDPSFMFGGLPLNFSDGTRITKSNYSVVEGDETPALYEEDQPKFAYYKPKYLLLTATEYDHPEVYKTQEDYLNVYINLVKLLPSDGVFFYDPNTVDEKVINACNCKKVEYLTKTKIILDKKYPESSLRSITLCNELKIDQQVIEESIHSFRGLKARNEFLGEFGGRFLCHDLSQQSSKVKSSISSLRKQYPKNRIIVVFNPSATSMKYKECLGMYFDAFQDADQVIVGKVDYINSVAKEDRVTGLDLVKAFGGNSKAIYMPVNEKIVEWIIQNTKSEDVIIFMSSGGLEFMELIERAKGELGGLGKPGRIEKVEENRYDALVKLLGSEKVRKNVSLAEYTTFKIGGPADLFYEAETEEDLVSVFKAVKEFGIPYFVLGGGSNILVGDKGFRGIVIKVKNKGIKIQEENGKYKVIVQAGEMISDLLNELSERSLTGLEFMAGIPGTVGATVACNAGAWQRNLSEAVIKVKVLTKDCKIKWIDKENCMFDYRTSKFKGGDDLILAVELELTRGEKAEITEQIGINLEKRRVQPREPSAGSIFINPKPLKSGALIEECGLKGTQIGGAKISEKHANFIVNTGGAKASDVIALINLAKEKVKEKFNIDLQEEVVRMGEF